MLRAFEVMVGQDIGLLKGLSAQSYWDFRNAVAGCILATDFAKHSSYCDKVGTLCLVSYECGRESIVLGPFSTTWLGLAR